MKTHHLLFLFGIFTLMLTIASVIIDKDINITIGVIIMIVSFGGSYYLDKINE